MAMTETDQLNNVEYLKALYPWIGDIGIGFDQLREWVVDGLEPEAIVQAVRNTPQWQGRFLGIRRQDGTLRMNEAQFFQREDEIRQVLKQGGFDVPDTPAARQAIFENDLDPNELQTRVRMYNALEDGGADVKDAFYVYAGLKVTTDDLFEAMVYGDTALFDTYNAQVATSSLDYDTWITRATEVGLEHVVEKLEELERWGAVTGDVVAKVRNLDPAFAKQMMGALYNGVDGAEPLDLASLERAFEYSMIGGAATEQGLRLPDQDRIKAIRSAGIERAQAIQGYSQFAMQRGRINAAAQRVGASGFSQADFEDAVFLQRADQAQLLERAQRFDESLGAASGAAGFSRTESGGIGQTGLRRRF